MLINVMTWNTQLYEYGNKICRNNPPKPIDYFRCKKVFELIKEYLDKQENAIAVLQEIPLHSNITYREHEIFTMLCTSFPEEDYSRLYNVNEKVRNQIKMTVAISHKDFIEKDKDGINSSNKDFCNCFVSFKVEKLKVLAVHQSLNGEEGLVTTKLGLHSDYTPDIILGDFNAGDYEKANEDNVFRSNRENYRIFLRRGYVDLCQGRCTTLYGTSIDHILISDGNLNHECSEIEIDNKIKLSDHYPIYCKIMIPSR